VPSVASWAAAPTLPANASNIVPARPPAAPTSRSASSGVGCVDQGCLDRLKTLLEDPEHKWIGQPQSLKEHADGTRQFAYRALRARLTCRELALAMDDITKAMRAFLAPVAGVTADQVTRVRALDAQVHDELRAEHANRCSG
jgi:hypothetical protein